jgi:hypothetical protein
MTELIPGAVSSPEWRSSASVHHRYVSGWWPRCGLAVRRSPRCHGLGRPSRSGLLDVVDVAADAHGVAQQRTEGSGAAIQIPVSSKNSRMAARSHLPSSMPPLTVNQNGCRGRAGSTVNRSNTRPVASTGKMRTAVLTRGALFSASGGHVPHGCSPPARRTGSGTESVDER